MVATAMRYCRNKISRNVAPLTSVAGKSHGNASANLFWAFVILMPSPGSRKNIT